MKPHRYRIYRIRHARSNLAGLHVRKQRITMRFEGQAPAPEAHLMVTLPGTDAQQALPTP